MKLKKYEKQTVELFREPLALRGFSPQGKDVKFVREKNDVLLSIGFPGRWEYRTERYKFTIVLANRYLMLKRLLKPVEGDHFLPAVAETIHGLWEKQHYTEWYLNDPETLPYVLEQIDKYGIPFLEKFSDFTNLKERLDSPDPSCFGLSREKRICLRAAIMAYEDHPAEALVMVDEALKERKGVLPKYRIALEELRSRLVGMSIPKNSAAN